MEEEKKTGRKTSDVRNTRNYRTWYLLLWGICLEKILEQRKKKQQKNKTAIKPTNSNLSFACGVMEKKENVRF